MGKIHFSEGQQVLWTKWQLSQLLCKLFVSFRFIVHSDSSNPKVSSLEPFGPALAGFKPNLFLVSGLQMMDNFPFAEGERLSRLLKIQAQMRSQDFESTRIHFEMASFVDQTLLEELTRYTSFSSDLGLILKSSNFQRSRSIRGLTWHERAGASQPLLNA